MAVASYEEAAERTWAHVVERAQAELTESSFSLWFQGVRATSLHDGVLEVVAPSEYVREWLARNYVELIQQAAAEALGCRSAWSSARHRPKWLHRNAEPPRPRAAGISRGKDRRRDRRPRPRRRSAPRGSRSRTTRSRPSWPGRRTGSRTRPRWRSPRPPPSKAYNPLFIYGGVGLGKTHLLVAIGHQMFGLSPRLRVKYVTSESFMAEFIKAVRERQGYQFAARYRDVDVLLVDDIQFLAKREETQTEFFHTFNALHQKDRQIVIASDRPPQELGMEERLQSRFRLGLCVDVQPPDLETRIAILQLKAQRDQPPGPRRRDRVHREHVRPEHPRARGRPRPRRGLGGPHRPADHDRAWPSRRWRTSAPRPRPRSARPDPRGDALATSACRSTT